MLETFEWAPALLCAQAKSGYESQNILSGDTASNFLRSSAHGVKGGFDGVGGATVLLVRCRIVAEGEQVIPIPGQEISRLGVQSFVGSDEAIERGSPFLVADTLITAS